MNMIGERGAGLGWDDYADKVGCLCRIHGCWTLIVVG